MISFSHSMHICYITMIKVHYIYRKTNWLVICARVCVYVCVCACGVPFENAFTMVKFEKVLETKLQYSIVGAYILYCGNCNCTPDLTLESLKCVIRIIGCGWLFVQRNRAHNLYNIAKHILFLFFIIYCYK